MNLIKEIYEEVISEKYSKGRPLIVVDIQPYYEKYIKKRKGKKFITNFIHFLNLHRGPINYFFNGDEIGLMDEREELFQWLLEWGLDESVLERIKFSEKGYGFFRGLMDSDNEVSRGFIKKLIRYMIINKIQDSREVESEEFLDYKDLIMNEPIFLPNINIAELKAFENCYICGGGEHECLSEIRLLLEAFNFKYKILKELVSVFINSYICHLTSKLN